ncbi:Arc family DNA-binding protein [Providencia rettgeri]|uniref:Arc family DNA-binding protein n=1 Tax=Providencia rettgeri TaxID=587 RepID=UPI0024ABD5C6|nr:Arc family DNA-binding protein [Providencia rettgeri]
MKKANNKQKVVRMSEDLVCKIKEAAYRNRRSENQEMLLRLEMSFDDRVQRVIRQCL